MSRLFYIYLLFSLLIPLLKTTDPKLGSCTPNPCLNGVCTEDDAQTDSFSCFCLDGWTGSRCDRNFDECLPGRNQCQNNATCVNSVPDAKCLCPAGFCGKFCEMEIDDCTSSPCLNGGMCRDRHLGFQCLCPLGYSGDRCQIDQDACDLSALSSLNRSAHCENGGTCQDGPGNAYFCLCPLGYSGEHCETLVDECESGPCENGGRCEKHLGGFTCVCTYGWSGPTCERPLRRCTENHCTNQAALCMEPLHLGSESLGPETPPKFTCYCPPDYHGPHCQHRYNDCTVGSCQNGATCLDAIDGVTCQCAPGYAGPDCAVNCRQEPEAEACKVPLETTTKAPIIEPSNDAATITTTTESQIEVTPTPTIPVTTISTQHSGTPTTTTETPITPSPTTPTPPPTATTHLEPEIQYIFAPSFTSPSSELAFRVRRLKRHSTALTFDLILGPSETPPSGTLLYANTSMYHLELYLEDSQLHALLWSTQRTREDPIIALQNSHPLVPSLRYTLALRMRHDTSPTSLYTELSLLNGTELLSSVSALASNVTVPCFECYQFGVSPVQPDLGPFTGCLLGLDINGEELFPRNALFARNISECSQGPASISLCELSPCRNNGFCNSTTAESAENEDENSNNRTWTCFCPPGFGGWRCEEALCNPTICANGGLCLVSENRHLCVCTAGYLGPRCEEKMNLTFPLFNIGPNASFLKYRLPYDLKEFFEIRFRFISHEPKQKLGLLMFMSQSHDSLPNGSLPSSSDFISLIYDSRKLHLRLNLGQGERSLVSPVESNLTEQMVLFGRFHQTFWLLVVPAQLGPSTASTGGPSNGTQLAPQVGRMPLHHRYLNVDPYLYVGGHEDWKAHSALAGLSGFKGCIYDIDLRNYRSSPFTRLNSTLIDHLANIHQCDFECT